MNIQKYYRLINEEEELGIEDLQPLKDLVEEYPYFQSAIFQYLKAVFLYNSEGFNEELKRLSISVNDRRALFYYIFSDEYARFFERTGRKDIGEDRTSVLLNAFFESRDDVQTELEYTIGNSSVASTDYFAYIQSDGTGDGDTEQQEEPPVESNLKHHDIIDTFIARSEQEGGLQIHIDREEDLPSDNFQAQDEEKDDELDDDMFFTETLSKIYIKQKKYEKAYKIIKHLSLNYPKKNIYFADQLSFLEKLIINSKFKDKK